MELNKTHCMDALEGLEAIETESIDHIVTDPPYSSGGRQQSDQRLIISKGGEKWRPSDEWFVSDNMGSDSYVRFMRQIAMNGLRVCKKGAHAYVFTDWRQYTNLVTAWESVGWTLRSVIVWDKGRGGAMGSFWRNNHEWICVFVKGVPKKLPDGSFFNTWTGTKPQAGYHPTEKPLGLLRYIIRGIEGTILDPFAGSGTTWAACKQLGRNFIGFELNPSYIDIGVKRVAQRTLNEVDDD